VITVPWFNVELPEDLARKFKVKVTDKFGQYRGNVSRAFMEAIELWLKKEQGEENA